MTQDNVTKVPVVSNSPIIKICLFVRRKIKTSKLVMAQANCAWENVFIVW